MFLSILLPFVLLVKHSIAQSSTESISTSASYSQPTFDVPSSLGSIVTITAGTANLPTGSYPPLPSTQSTLTPGNTPSNKTLATTSTSNSLLLIGTSTSGSSSTTSSSALPQSNTTPCNNYPELCNREYMSFTEVCSHNSAFVRANNAASNQVYGIIAQLNDGVRMIQGETHFVNNTMYSCHTSCDILNAGTLESELDTVASWVRTHPYDVVTILLVNSDFRNVTDYVAPIQNSGLAPYLYTPPKVPMHRGDWPTLGSMILSGKRVVVFLDYQANQTTVPYILDEFSQLWETPFSPQDPSFPCSQQRPPGLNSDQQNLVPYLVNHNLNVEVSLGSSSILIPNFATLDQINSVSGIGTNGSTGALGSMADECTRMWGHPPSWLLVDFYERGNSPGDVFEVAARMNGLDYTRGDSCCGENTGVSAAAAKRRVDNLAGVVVAVAMMVGAWSLVS